MEKGGCFNRDFRTGCTKLEMDDAQKGIDVEEMSSDVILYSCFDRARRMNIGAASSSFELCSIRKADHSRDDL